MIEIIILWIDDSESWSLSAQTNLNLIASKYKIRLHFINAINGENIVQQCVSYNFDAIVMDYDMKPFSGEKYIKDIRFEEHLEMIPIIFYSQNNSVNLSSLVEGISNIDCVYRPNLEDAIKDMFFK